MVEEENVKTLKGTKKKIDIETRRKINYKQTVEISVGAINNGHSKGINNNRRKTQNEDSRQKNIQHRKGAEPRYSRRISCSCYLSDTVRITHLF